MNVLILGGSGFLGTAVAQACVRSGASVRVLSRGGRTTVGEGVRGDVRMPRLGLSAADLTRIRAETTHAVCCFGSVSWIKRVRRDLRPSDRIVQDLEIDSLATLEILLALEERFGVALVDNLQAARITTVGDLVALLDELRAGRAS